MPVEPLVHQPKEHSLYRKCVPEGDLIFDDDVYPCVNGFIGKADSLTPVIFRD